LAVAILLGTLVLRAPAAHAQGATDELAKAANKCQRAITKAASTFAAAELKSLRVCFDAVFRCVQVKPQDDGCGLKAGISCGKAAEKADAQADKLRSAIDRACPSDTLPFDTLVMVRALDLGGLSDVCAGLGISLDSLSDYEDCLIERLTRL